MSAGVTAIRRSVGLSDRAVSWVRTRGEAAYDVLDRVLPCDMYLRDGQMRPTLLLDARGDIAADVNVLADDGDYLISVDGIAADAAAELFMAQRRPGEDATFEATDLATVGLDGPFAWEVMGAFDTPGVVGLPYMTSYRPVPDVLVVRAGRTGEYGYDLIVPADRADAVRARLVEIGAGFDLGVADAAALSYCALENFFFDARTEKRPGIGPIELQLQWRISRKKPFLGAEAVASRRCSARRAVAFRCGTPVDGGAAVLLDDRVVGDVLRAERSLHGEGFIGLAVIDAPLAHSGVRALAVHTVEGPAPIATVSAPFVANRSLFVKPQQHSWADRARIAFPA